ARGANLSIGNTTLDGRPVGVAMEAPTTAFLNTDDLTPGKAVTVAMSFSLTLPGLADDRLSRSGNTVRLGSWLPTLSWEPGYAWTLDPPTTNDAEASTSIAADYDVLFAVPAGLTVLASGEEVEPGRWKATAMPDWGATVGTFTIVRGMAGSVPVIVGVETSVGESPTTYLNRVIGSLQALAARYGPYPYPNYSLAITPGLRGGIEYPGHVMQGPGSNARTTPHEVAHMWFYSLVGSNQGRDPWLDEGLSSWAEAVINGSYRSFVTRPIPSDGRNRIGEPMTFWDQHSASYYRSVYVQTVQALAATGASIAAIDCALARYVAAHAYRVANPADLVRALETVAPNARDVLARYGVR
ncbi:MAG: M1 family aminopeptidase, partial [Acidimicrobiales bacterium]|nr:M1 family aminopeptidase [Acidimicrobiales bacterium]